MKERPILFNTEMVQAILSGRKTQTRRPVKPQSAILTDEMARACGIRPPAKQNSPVIPCPYGTVGDRLWIKETWNHPDDPAPYRAGDPVFYRADYADDPHGYDGERSPEGKYRRWRPSIHMPRTASRITLEITDIRIERLQNISAEDAIAEGIQHTGTFVDDPIRSFQNLIESIHGAGYWQTNPWVWVVEFKKLENLA